jgi:limonene-1,2-epoxide hydrolase
MRLIAAWKAGDLEAVGAHLTDDFDWHYAATIAPPVTGKAAVLRAMAKLSAGQREVQWRIRHHAEAGDLLFVEGVDEFINAAGQTIKIPYAGVLEFRGDLICAWRDYFDMGGVDAQAEGRPRTAWADALIARAY